MNSPLEILKKTYGYDSFRGNQAAIIEHVIAGGNAFVLMPTGGGKSLCYQIPALCRAGVGIIISPLIALMQDQVAALQQLGIRAAAINSSIDAAEVQQTKRDLRAGNIDLVYVSPEQLLMDNFLSLLEQSPLALFAIDEAHCISQWGHDFRPEYAQLSILAEKFPHVPRIALTATADAPTRSDILERLQLKHDKIFVAGFDRPNIHYTIVENSNARQQLLKFIRENHPQDSGIVYCLSRKKVEDTAEWLSGQGFLALPYHAGLSAEKRQSNQMRFLREEKMIMVATIAFGMGIDKSNVRFVAHLNIPRNIEAYYQETGRAGRDGLAANAWMSYGLSDVVMQRNFIDSSEAPEKQKRIEHQKLTALLGLCEASVCRRKVLLDYFGDRCEACQNCDNCLNKPDTFDGTIAAQKALSCVYRTGERFGVSYLIDVLLGANDERIKKFAHDKISTFGIGKEYDKKQWQSIFRQLVANHLLKVDVAGHGGLSITPPGQSFLKEKQVIQFRQQKTGSSVPQKTKASTAMQFVNQQEKSLFDLLRAKRLELAKAQHIPPYVIFHDSTLIELAKRQPSTLEEMASISGIGQVKIQRYGELFLRVIQGEESVINV